MNPESTESPENPIVLVVDDEAGVRKIARRLLEAEGFTVIDADSGEAAMRALQGERTPSVALIDLTMPGQDGIDVARELRGRVADLTVVIMSGFGRSDVVAMHHPDDIPPLFLGKPFSRSSLLSMLEKALQHPEERPAP